MINIREDYLLKIKNIPDVSFNKEQKEIAKNIETQNIIINISNSPINEPKIKWCNILCSLVESTIFGLGSLFIKNTLK